MHTLGDFVWHAPPPLLALGDGTTTHSAADRDAGARAVFAEGEQVRAKFMATELKPSDSKFLPGVVSKVYPGAGEKADKADKTPNQYTYDITYEDGRSEANVQAHFVKVATRGEEDEDDGGAEDDGGGRGLCVSSVSLCGEGGEWAWGDDAVSMARLPLHGIGVALTELRCQTEEVRLRLPSRLLDLAGELSARLLPSGAERVKWAHPVRPLRRRTSTQP